MLLDLTSRQILKRILRAHGIRPKKHWGQNFLVSKSVLEKFIDSANISRGDIIVEAGAGIGTITIGLAKRAKKVIAVEKDPFISRILSENVKNVGNVKIVQDDIRKFTPKPYHLKPKTYKVIGNLPFYLSNFLIRKFLESDTPPKDMTLIVQKEVAQRICAKPPRMNLLAVAVQYFAEPKITSYVSKKSFWPEPEVDAAILKITPLSTANINTKDHEIFFGVVRTGFSHPRKYLIRNLEKGLKIPRETLETTFAKLDIAKNVRAQELPLPIWNALVVHLRNI